LSARCKVPSTLPVEVYADTYLATSPLYYNNGMPAHVTLLEKAADPAHKQDYRATMVTIGGSGFDWHDVEPNAIGSYSFDDHNNVVFDKSDKLFDAAVMMDCSQWIITGSDS
jgi:hypothetical protein